MVLEYIQILLKNNSKYLSQIKNLNTIKDNIVQNPTIR